MAQKAEEEGTGGNEDDDRADLYLVEDGPGLLRVDLEVLGLDVADPVIARLLAGHSVGSPATRPARCTKTAKRDEAREEAGPPAVARDLALSVPGEKGVSGTERCHA